MRDEIVALGLITVGLIAFEIINTVGIKQTGTVPGLLRYALMTGVFQIGAYFIFVWGLNMGYTAFSNDIWFLMLAQTSVSYFVKISVRYLMFHQPIAKGNIAGLALAILGAFVSKFWR